MNNIRLGDVLIDFGYITQDQLQAALAYQKEHKNLRVGQALQELGYVNERQVLEALAQRLHLRGIDFTQINADISAVEKVPLYGRSMSTEYYIRMSFDEKCVLHIACRMIFGKVQCREYMPVVFDFRTFGDAESQTCEDINDFVLYNCNRMTCTEFNRISRAGQVKTVATIILALELFLQRIDFVLRFSFQFIQSHFHVHILIDLKVISSS